MLMKAQFLNIAVVQTSRHERYNDEDGHISSLQVTTKQIWVKAHDMHFVELPWCYDTLHADVNCMHFVDCDMKENVRKVDHLRCACVLAV